MERLDEHLEGTQAGDADAFAAIYERLRIPVFRYLVACTRDRDEAEDLLSDVFVAVAQGIRRFEGDSDAFVGWVFTIARHDVLDRRRRLGRRSIDPVAEPPEREHQPDLADRVAEQTDALVVRTALDRLTDDQREVLVMRFVADRSLEEVAAALGKPVGAVKSLQHRGLAALRKILEPGT